MRQKNTKFMDLILKKMNIESKVQFIIVMIVFSITGSLSLYLTIELLMILDIKKLISPFIFWPIRVVTLFLIYQVMLIFIASLFGQFSYFWKFEKKFLKRLGFKFSS